MKFPISYLPTLFDAVLFIDCILIVVLTSIFYTISKASRRYRLPMTFFGYSKAELNDFINSVSKISFHSMDIIFISIDNDNRT